MPALPSKTQGKLVDMWIYAYRGPEQPEPEDDDPHDPKKKLITDQRVELRVYIVKEQKALNEPPHLTSAVKFRVECDNPKFHIFGTDLELLRKDGFARCDDRFKTQWTPYYLVEVRPDHPYQGLGAGLCFSYRQIEKGIAWDGTELLKDRDWNARRYEDKIEAWPGDFTDKQGKVVACIPKTPANDAALEEFTRRIVKLRENIGGLLEPKVIMQTLTHLSQLTIEG